MRADLACCQRQGQDANGGNVKHAALLAFAAACAGIGMHERLENRVLLGARIMRALQCDRLVDDRAHPIADVASEPQHIEARLAADERGNAHLRLVDIGQSMAESPRRTRLHARNVVAHLAWNVTCDEVWRAGRGAVTGLRQFQGVVRARPNA